LSPTTPNWQRHYALTPVRFRLIPFRSPLLGESLLLSFPRATEMFHFTLFPLPELCIHSGVTPHDGCRVSPFGHPRVKAWSAAHRGFSQPPASFIGSRRQGIRRWLFVAWNLKIGRKMLVFAMQFSKGDIERARSDMSARAQARLAKGTLHSLKTEERMERSAIAGDTSELEYRLRRTDQTSQCLNRCSE
jgi:hypothetical protein